MVDFQGCKKSTEAIVGVNKDPNFGPMLMFGKGGVFANYEQDVAFELSRNYGAATADRQLRKTKIFQVLEGVRGQPPSDMAALKAVLLRLARLANAFPEISELDMNPLLVFAEGEGVSAVDVKITLAE